MPRLARAFRIACWLGILPLAAGSARAGGFALPDQTAWLLGAGGSGSARANGAQAISSNVAGLAFAEDPELSLGANLVLPMMSFDGQAPFPGVGVNEKQKLSPRFPPVVAFAQPLGRRLVAGVGVQVPFGLSTQWANESSFTGRFVAQQVKLNCVTLTPAVGIRLADRLAVGGGLDINLVSVDVARIVPVIDPFTLRRIDGFAVHTDGQRQTAVGFRVGLVARLEGGLDVGVGYRSGTTLDVTGNVAFDRQLTANAQLDNSLAQVVPPAAVPFSVGGKLPPVITAGLAYTWGPWAFSGDAAFMRWSQVGTVELVPEGYPALSTVIARDYSDTVELRVGIERRLNDYWTVRGGYFHAPSPVPTDALSPVFVDATGHGVTLGATVRSGQWQCDFAPGVVLSGARSTGGASPEGFDGSYDGTQLLLAVSVGRRF